MADEWYHSKDGQQVGPISTEQLKAAATSGELKPTDTVWKEGMTDWVPASKVSGLFPAPQSSPPPVANPKAVPPSIQQTPTAEPVLNVEKGISSIVLSTFLKKSGNKPRILLIITGGFILLCFFLPQFYVSLTIATMTIPWFLWGWSTWWGIVSFIFTFSVTVAVIVDLILPTITQLRFALRFFYPLVYLILSLTTFIGVLLAICGVGIGTSSYRYGISYDIAGDALFRFPIMAIPLLFLTFTALVISAMILVKELKKPIAVTDIKEN